ncbi:MAG: argininosuccinate lyase [Pseudomonadota bacterium]
MTDANKMWGGRFDEKPDDVMEQINASIDIDKRLYKQDIAGSKAHAAMLAKQNIISDADKDAIHKGLDQILSEIENGQFEFRRDLEDIHMNIENRLKEIIGEPAGRLHTARSRNDQVATDFRLWVREACDVIMERIEVFQETIDVLEEQHADTVMPGFTHLQVAQPVTLARHLDAYACMLNRDKLRFADCRKRLNTSPLGSAALAGTGFPINKDFTAEQLGFDRPVMNTMDGVSARDFANEFLFSCAQCGLHLSRLAEELIIWSTPQFGFVTMSDAWSTGSSIMPQKKNPDAAELIRGKTGRLTGNLVQMMTVMKALPLTYNKDLQEDKKSVFDSFDTMILCLDAMTGMLSSATWNKDAMLEAAQSGYSTATELADWLVRELNMPFRDAHHVTGRAVKLAEDKNCRLDELSLDDLQSVEAKITDDIFNYLSVENAAKSRK